MNKDIIIIGGGLSGVLFAHYAAKSGKNIVIFEKNDYLGGCIKSVKPHADSDFFMELGAHTIYASYATMIEALREAQLESKILPQVKAKMMFADNGEIRPIWRQIHPIEMIKHRFGASKYTKNKMTAKDFYTATVGKKNYDNLIGPAMSAIICQTADNVAADLLLKSRPKDKTLPKSFTITGGLSTYINEMTNKKNIEVHKSTSVTSITRDSEGKYTVTTDKGVSIQAPKLVMATEAYSAAALLKDISSELAELLANLPHHPSYAYAVAAESANIAFPRFSYLIAKNMPFRAVVSRDVIPHDKYRGVTFHFKDNKDFTIAKTMSGVANLADVAESEESFLLPELRLGHHEWRAKLEDKVRQIGGFYLIGNFFDGLAMEDCAIKAKQEALRAAAE